MHGVGKPPPPSKATGFVSVLSESFIETTEHALRNRNTATATRIFMGKPLLGNWDSPIITSAALSGFFFRRDFFQLLRRQSAECFTAIFETL
jgi:hypothetical protein